MGKSSKKLFVYLDQNFICNIGQFGKNPRVDPIYGDLFEILHQGCLDEKVFVPRSVFHDMEISLATHLRENVFLRLSQMGQVQLQHHDTIAKFQMYEAVEKFLNKESSREPAIFMDDPDDRVKMYDIRVDFPYEKLFDLRSLKNKTLDELSSVRDKVLADKITFEEQYKAEINMARQQVLREGVSAIGFLIRDQEQLEEFVNSPFFEEIPNIYISSRIWAAILTDRFGRSPIREGHCDDVKIISTFLPYADVFTTDSFMARMLVLLDIPTKYDTKVFSSSITDIKKMKEYLEEYLPEAESVNIPKVTIFVLSDKKIKEESFDFFKKIGNQIMAAESREGWVEVFAFDDGNMPEFSDPEIKRKIPFTGLQEIIHIPIALPQSIENIHSICKTRCRSSHYVLIDHYHKLPTNFIITLIGYAAEGRARIFNYHIVNKIK